MKPDKLVSGVLYRPDPYGIRSAKRERPQRPLDLTTSLEPAVLDAALLCATKPEYDEQ